MITGCTATVLRSAIPANAFTIPPLKTRSIAAGHYHSVVIREDGNLIGWGWGWNADGQTNPPPGLKVKLPQ